MIEVRAHPHDVGAGPLAFVNRCLDELPRPRIFRFGRHAPTFRACGVTGFYVALLVMFGAGFVAGRSALVLIVLAAISAASFYAYAYLRRGITGRETLVLLEHVWFALGCNALALWLIREPVLPYLDVFAVALCPFLAAGRIGCTLVGCCHGNPSSFGVRYNEECARDGFPSHLVGVRLFPVAALEAAGLLTIGVLGFVVLPFAAPGKVVAWYLLAYAIMRFGLEGIRADRRPHFLGLSQARWMTIVQFGAALWLGGGKRDSSSLLVLAVLITCLARVLALALGRERRVLAPGHLEELRRFANDDATRCTAKPSEPSSYVSSQQVVVAVSTLPNAAHISLSFGDGRRDLPLLCELAAHAFPDLSLKGAQLTVGRVLHFLVPTGGVHVHRHSADSVTQVLYASIVRRLQDGGIDAMQHSLGAVEQAETASASEATLALSLIGSGDGPPRWFFSDSGKGKQAGFLFGQEHQPRMPPSNGR